MISPTTKPSGSASQREVITRLSDIERGIMRIASRTANRPNRQGLFRIKQTGHGFVIGSPIRQTSGGWALSQADTAEHAVVSAVVASVQSDDICTAALPGSRINKLSGLTAGVRYYLDAAVAGEVTAVAPAITTVVYDAISSTEAIVSAASAASSSNSLEPMSSASPVQITDGMEWDQGRRLVTFLVIGGGGGGGGAASAGVLAWSPKYFWASGGGGSSGRLSLTQFIMEDGYTFTLTAGSGGSGGSATNGGNSGGQTTLVIKDAGGSTLLTITASGGVGGGAAESTTTCVPGLAGSGYGAFSGQPGRFAFYDSGFTFNDTRPAGGYIPIITTSTGAGGAGGYKTTTSGASGQSGGAYYI